MIQWTYPESIANSPVLHLERSSTPLVILRSEATIPLRPAHSGTSGGQDDRMRSFAPLRMTDKKQHDPDRT
jgi:hypothetical protein